ncbi:hypothetical protein CDL15_Pgr024015 [Punica granatum]|uniref:Uncharacterized protein n=1 Tax=Punica granatum TaxID=22663 RepID=A0A218XVC4_PUNGR|nr:hypothetical protein CDL15_Pgr024015 [Punica granatum]
MDHSPQPEDFLINWNRPERKQSSKGQQFLCLGEQWSPDENLTGERELEGESETRAIERSRSGGSESRVTDLE